MIIFDSESVLYVWLWMLLCMLLDQEMLCIFLAILRNKNLVINGNLTSGYGTHKPGI